MMPRILYVDEDVLNQRLVQKILRPMNYELLEANNGVQGIQMAETTLPHLVLVDIDLTDMMGYQLIEYLRQQAATARLPIVVLTNDVSDHAYTQCVDAGCNGYLLKPISSPNLLRTVRQFLTSSRTAPLG